MLRTGTLLSMALAFLLGVFLLPGSLLARNHNPEPPQPPSKAACTGKTDGQIRDAVALNLRKAFTKTDLTNLMKFNLTVKAGEVTMVGFAEPKKGQKPATTKNKIVRIAEKTACVTKVVHSGLDTIRGGGTCTGGQVKCGDICIDAGAPCFLFP